MPRDEPEEQTENAADHEYRNSDETHRCCLITLQLGAKPGGDRLNIVHRLVDVGFEFPFRIRHSSPSYHGLTLRPAESTGEPELFQPAYAYQPPGFAPQVLRHR